MTSDVLARYAAHLEQTGYAPKTQVNELTTMTQCIRWLTEEGHLVGASPIKLKLRKSESRRHYCYRHVEVIAILERCREEPSLVWVGEIVTGLACTGMRIGELASLRWSDVDMEGNRITLTDESGYGETGNVKRTLKSSRSRSFPIHDDLREVLESLPRFDRYVFHGPNRRRLNPDFARRVFLSEVLEPLAMTKFPARDGVQSFIDGRLHSFRHYFVSRCAASGVAERIVMEWVGHADSAMVRHYFHLHDEEAQRQMSGLRFLELSAGRSGVQRSGSLKEATLDRDAGIRET